MNDLSQPAISPTFPPGYRASGLLLHVTSLPSKYGIGDVGPAAMAWVDRLREADQSWWQALPLGPTGYGNSPYQLLSSFAGNSLLISPDGLIADGLLQASDVAGCSFSNTAVDYDEVILFKHRLLETAWSNFSASAPAELKVAYEEFRSNQSHWLDDYALFRAIKTERRGACFLDWPAELMLREPAALAKTRGELANRIDRVFLAQFLLFRQGERLKQHARARGVRLIGDLPFFVSLDSSDVWANPELFLLDERHRPRFVAGVPPDYFSAQGQLWGNPVYDWAAHQRTGFRWLLDRMRALLAFVDLIRLDHFRGFAAAWHIPAGAPTAQSGAWMPGPGAEFFHAVRREFGALPFIAEDLGMISPDVVALRDQFELPGTRVLQFAFDGDSNNPHLPRNYAPNAVAYTGTHDNNTTRGWYEREASADQRERLWRYLQRVGGDSSEVAPALLRAAWSSVAALAIAPLQDLLNLGADARMNVPGSTQDNWRWRCREDQLSVSAFGWLRNLTNDARRAPGILPFRKA